MTLRRFMDRWNNVGKSGYIGQVFGEPLTDKQRAVLCEGDRNVWRNVTGLITAGVDPLQAAIARGHEHGLKVYTRLEMNHEYGPPSDDNWLWVGFVGDFNKQNPQYRIPGHVNLDYSYPEVRQFKLAILREAAERGSDGLSLDFTVYPPFFEHPNAELMTAFLRDVRTLADDIGDAQRRHIDIKARIPSIRSIELGLDWKRWMHEKLIDAIVPSFDDYGTDFDLNVDEFISMRNRTGVKVYGSLFQELGFYDSDPAPDDEKIGRKYDKAKTSDIWRAQAMLLHRAGVDGIQLAMAADEWNQYPLSFVPRPAGYFTSNVIEEHRHLPFFNDLADPTRILYADKRYMVNLKSSQEPTLTFTDFQNSHTLLLRIADDPIQAAADGHDSEVELLIYLNRFLVADEYIEVAINGKQCPRVNRESLSWNKPIPERFNHFDPDWWRVGEHTICVDSTHLRLGENMLTCTHVAPDSHAPELLEARWIDLKISYKP